MTPNLRGVPAPAAATYPPNDERNVPADPGSPGSPNSTANAVVATLTGQAGTRARNPAASPRTAAAAGSALGALARTVRQSLSEEESDAAGDDARAERDGVSGTSWLGGDGKTAAHGRAVAGMTQGHAGGNAGTAVGGSGKNSVKDSVGAQACEGVRPTRVEVTTPIAPVRPRGHVPGGEPPRESAAVRIVAWGVVVVAVIVLVAALSLVFDPPPRDSGNERKPHDTQACRQAPHSCGR